MSEHLHTQEVTDEERAARRREMIETVLADYLDNVDPEEVDTADLADNIAGALESGGLA